MTHHSILSYQERLAAYLEQLALAPRSTPGASLGSGAGAGARAPPSPDASDPASLFRLAPGTDAGGSHRELLQGLGRMAGGRPCLFWIQVLMTRHDARPSRCCIPRGP